MRKATISVKLTKAVYKNIKTVGLPAWDPSDQQLAKAVQKLVDAPAKTPQGVLIDGLNTKQLDTLNGPVQFSWGAGSDDIADIAWNVPTVVFHYPAKYKSYLEQLGINYPQLEK